MLKVSREAEHLRGAGGGIKRANCTACGRGRIRITQWVNVYSCDDCRVGYGQPAGEPNRVGCCIPYCRATRGDRKGDQLTEHMEWICSWHWRSVSPRLKRRRAKLRRMLARTIDPARRRRIDKADGIAWAACKRAVIEAAGGIG